MKHISLIVLHILQRMCRIGTLMPYSLLVGLLLPMQMQAGERLDIIPRPQAVTYAEGTFTLPQTFTVSDKLTDHLFTMLQTTLRQELWIEAVKATDEQSLLRFTTDAGLDAEAYRLVVDTTHITVYASAEEGTLWAVQTLRQLIKQLAMQYPGQAKKIPAVRIEDKPTYAWRGFHLDVSRHFFDKPYLLKTIERLSFYKINKLHLHLSDDQGWRIEIEKYPLLTEVGAYRTFNRHDSICLKAAQKNPDMMLDKRYIKDNTQYGGYYTKQDMREIIQHAAGYGIEIIPEIDMPGHMSAAIRAYPWLSCTGEEGWGEEFSYPVCPCNPAVISFAKEVYAEIADLFPSSYIHIGADEVEKHTWDASPECRQLMKKKRMKSSVELQTYFVDEMQKFLESRNKKVIAWDDAAEGQVNNRLIITYWRDWLKENPGKIVQQGNPMIFMPWNPFYISSNPTPEIFKRMYEFNPATDYPGMDASSIIGYQACVWTEWIPNEIKLEEHIYPAIQAFSELTWTHNADWEGFMSRLKLHQRLMDKAGVRYHVYE